MSVIIRLEQTGNYQHPEFIFHCPGCNYNHWFNTRTDGTTPVWSWNNDYVKPTIHPSIKVQAKYHCHFFIKDGNIQFLNDCDHELKGQTVPLPEIDGDGDPIDGEELNGT